ncbi:MAG: Rab family GTPase [Candidatus Hermodarchaeota archaeon]
MIRILKNRRIIICGPSGVGKTTLFASLIEKRFIEDTNVTFGIEFYMKQMSISGNEIMFSVWDLSGRHQALESIITTSDILNQGVDKIIVCFDLSDLSTLEEVPQWVELFPSDIPKILVGTKRDKTGSIHDLVIPYLKTFNFKNYFEISAKEEIQTVLELFKELSNEGKTS